MQVYYSGIYAQQTAVQICVQREVRLARSADGEVGVDNQFTVRQRDGAEDSKINGVVGRSIGDGVTQRAGAVVIQVRDRECRRRQRIPPAEEETAKGKTAKAASGGGGCWFHSFSI